MGTEITGCSRRRGALWVLKRLSRSEDGVSGLEGADDKLLSSVGVLSTLLQDWVSVGEDGRVNTVIPVEIRSKSTFDTLVGAEAGRNAC